MKKTAKTADKEPVISFTLKGGQVITYDKPFDMKADKFLVKFRLVRNGESEGPWVRIHPDDFKAYESDSTDRKVRLAVMFNDCLNGIPWLAITPYVMKGQGRPECNMNELIDLTGVPQFVSIDTGLPITMAEYEAFRSPKKGD